MNNKNIIQAIFVVNVYRTALKKILEQIKKEYTIESFVSEICMNDLILKTMDKLNILYTFNLRTCKVTLYNKIDNSINASITLLTNKEQWKKWELKYERETYFRKHTKKEKRNLHISKKI